MIRLSTAFLTIVLVIAVYQDGGVTAEDTKVDQTAEEAKNRAVTIIEGPKYVATQTPIPPSSTTQTNVQTPIPEPRQPSKPPLVPEKPQAYLVDLSRHYYGQMQKIPPSRPYPKHLNLPHLSKNSVYKFPRVIPLPHHMNHFYMQQPRPLLYTAAPSTSKPAVIAKRPPKFSLPVQTINGIRSDFVRPPKDQPNSNTTTKPTTTASTTTSTETTTTARALRTKRIWPTRLLRNNTNNINQTSPLRNMTIIKDNSTKTNITDHDFSASHNRIRAVPRQQTTSTTLASQTKRSYRPVTRRPKIKSTTVPSTVNFTHLEPNDWVPIVPSHYPTRKSKRPNLTPASRRSDVIPNLTHNRRSDVGFDDPEPSQTPRKQMMYLQSFGLVPVKPTQIAETTPVMDRKRMVYFQRKRQPAGNPHYSGYSTVRGVHSPSSYDQIDLQTEASHTLPRVVTKIKHHHHHHHHRYVKTVEKKVPYKVEVPKPYPVQVEKKVPVPVEKIKYVDKPVPYPVTVEKKVPYPVGIRVPHPVPVKVVEKEYVPKPYPIVHHVPVVKHVQVKVPQPVPYPVEKRVPYPVEVKVPVQVDRPVPVPVTVEKRVPYPVPYRVYVPQPYPVETKVPYPVQVKEPVEVVKHVPIKVPVPQPYAVKVPHPVPVPFEKKVPYPVEVEKKVPVPYQVYVPQRVEVEKKVPVYVPEPYPVEKRIPYPVKVPYPVQVPVKVPVKVPVQVPIYIHGPAMLYDSEGHFTEYGGSNEISKPESETVTLLPHHTVTVHGNGAYSVIQSRSDTDSTDNKSDISHELTPSQSESTLSHSDSIHPHNDLPHSHNDSTHSHNDSTHSHIDSTSSHATDSTHSHIESTLIHTTTSSPQP